MKYFFILFCVALGHITLSAQKQGSTKSKNQQGTVQKHKVKQKTSPVHKPVSTPLNDKTAGETSIRDRINQRLKDSATNQQNTVVQQAPSVINGIMVNNTEAAAKGRTGVNNDTAASRSGIEANNNNTINNQAIQGNTGNQPAGTLTNNSATGSKASTTEQSQYNTSDLNRNQMNVINQNQNASSPQNTGTGGTSNTLGVNQWGQNQVGESLFTPPPSIISSGFGKDYPAIRNATWSVDNNKNYMARYKSGDWWTTSTYNAGGIRLDTRTEIPLNASLPAAINIYKEKQSQPLDFTRISRIERPGKPEVYEVRLNTGRLFYLNLNGAEVDF